jgi:hypothetical protein
MVTLLVLSVIMRLVKILNLSFMSQGYGHKEDTLLANMPAFREYDTNLGDLWYVLASSSYFFIDIVLLTTYNTTKYYSRKNDVVIEFRDYILYNTSFIIRGSRS